MEYQTLHTLAGRVWALARAQHGVIARWQLVELGFHAQAIKRRLANARLHRTEFRGVYAVGRPELTQEGKRMAATLACGPGAYRSHLSAARLWQLLPKAPLRPSTSSTSLRAELE